MILDLRKRHFEIWVILAVLLPAGIIGTYVLPRPNLTDNYSETSQYLYNDLIHSVERTDYKITLRKNEENKLQIDWLGKTAMKAAGPFIKLIVKGRSETLGNVGSKGRLIFYSGLPYQDGDDVEVIISDAITGFELERIMLIKSVHTNQP
jgi:hypothetical protein